MVTIKDVAKVAGVSHSTVSRALTRNVPVAPETRERILSAITALGYRPNDIAKALKAGKTRTVALVLPRIDWTIFPQIAKGVENRARQRGYLVILCDTHEDTAIERDYVDRLKNRSVDGFIICTYAGNDETFRRLRQEAVPVVALLRGLESVPVDMVLAENVQAARQATLHLVARGCRRIAFINHNTRIMSYAERSRGYELALQDSGLAFDPAIVAQDVPLGYAGARDAAEGILRAGGEFDGLFCTSDAGAAGVLLALGKRGIRVPEQVKVMGFGGIDCAKLVMPNLTTMEQQSTRMGEMAADRLIDLIEKGARAGGQVVERLEARLIRGGTA